MKTIYETGHAKNAANFETLISFITAYGPAYNPSRASIALGSLQTVATNANAALAQVNTVLASYGNAVAAREVAFEPLKKLSTRLVNALKATDVAEAVIENLQAHNRKIQGQRATAKAATATASKIMVPPVEAPSNQVSASQQSFDSQLDTFNKMIKLLASIPAYAPNEAELNISRLDALYTALKTENAAVVNNVTQLSNARLARNEIMYHPETGLVATAADAKSYVKSLFGASHANYKQISGLEFKIVKSK